MQSNKTLFFGIIALAIIIVIGLFLARFLVADELNLPTGPEKISIRLVAAPSIKPWVDQAAQAFNQSNPNTQVEIIEAEDLIPQAQFRSDPQVAPPAAWLAEATFVVEMAGDSGLQFNDARSVASTSLAWGAFKDKQEAFAQKYGPLSWTSVHTKATAMATDDFLTLVIAPPQNSAEGLAALISATAAHLNKQSLASADVSQSDAWLNETFAENTHIPPRPAEAFATSQGRSLGDAGLLTMASWRSVGLTNKDDFAVTPAQPNVTLDYPLAIFPQAAPPAQQAAAAFRDFLLAESQQNALANFSFDRANASQAGVKVDGATALALLRWAERTLR